ncbi:MAG: thiamine pyrophosphate-binding protein [Planctomycetaceae bacterium]
MLTSGSHAFLQLIADAGVKYLFGNPGTTELPLFDALVDHPRIELILGLQEIPVMAMADGFAQASGNVGVVNVHISCGLGNAMGMLYNAYREGTPLLLTAGQQDQRLKFGEPILGSDMLSVVRPWTKWAAEVERVEDLPTAVRRAVQTALMPPTGPVFLAIPVNVQQEIAELDLTPPKPLDSRVRPPLDALRHAAELLASAENPVILAGSRIVPADAVAEMVEIAELLGAPVLAEPGTTRGRLGFPCDHRLSAPALQVYSPGIRQQLDEFDVLFCVSMDLLQLYVYFEPENPLPDHLRVVHLDQNAWSVGKNYPTEVGLVGDPKSGLKELAGLLRGLQTERQRDAVRRRTESRAAIHRRLKDDLVSRAAAERDMRPLTPLAAMSSLARALPDNAAVVAEAVTTAGTALEQLGAIKDPSGYFAHRGWALGWGVGMSLGVQLAWPDRPVLGIIGEGAALYGIQGLWSAAHHRIPATFVICNNAQYRILKGGAKSMSLPRANEGRFAGMDLTEPEIDMVALSRSLGVAAERITDPEELTEKVRASLAGDVPRLFDVPIDRNKVGG